MHVRCCLIQDVPHKSEMFSKQNANTHVCMEMNRNIFNQMRRFKLGEKKCDVYFQAEEQNKYRDNGQLLLKQ